MSVGNAVLLVRGFIPNWDFSRVTWDEVRSGEAAMEGRIGGRSPLVFAFLLATRDSHM